MTKYLHEQVLGIDTGDFQSVLVASPLGSAGWILDDTGFIVNDSSDPIANAPDEGMST